MSGSLEGPALTCGWCKEDWRGTVSVHQVPAFGANAFESQVWKTDTILMTVTPRNKDPANGGYYSTCHLIGHS